MTTFTTSAAFNVSCPVYPTIVLHPDQPTSFDAVASFPSLEEARAYAASLPKMLNAKAGPSWTREGAGGYVRISAKLGASGNHGVQNETGVKRVRRFLKLLDVKLAWHKPAKNAYESLNDFLAAL